MAILHNIFCLNLGSSTAFNSGGLEQRNVFTGKMSNCVRILTQQRLYASKNSGYVLTISKPGIYKNVFGTKAW